MLQLQLIWWTSLALATAAMLVMFILTVRRAREESRLQHDEQVRKAIQGILFKYMDSREARESDIDNLTNLQKRDKTVLRKLAIDLSHLVRGHERDRLIELLEAIGLQKECLSDVHSKDLELRTSAIRALQIFSDDTSRQALLRALEDRNPSIRMAAADALLHTEALPPLDTLMARLNEQSLLESMDMRSLMSDIARRAPASLVQLARKSKGQLAVERVIADALSDSSDYSVITTLIGYSQSDDMDLRARAIRSLGELHHPAAAAVVQEALSDLRWQIRAVAARAAGQIGLEQCINGLNFLLDDRNWWVRFRAAEALWRLGGNGIAVLKVRASYSGCGGFGRGARISALVLDEHGIHDFADTEQSTRHSHGDLRHE